MKLTTISLSQALGGLRAELKEHAAHGKPPGALWLGWWPSLSEKMGWFRVGQLTILAGRPGDGKCLGKGTKVIMYDGRQKAVEDVVVGDLLMGPDSNPRTVLSLGRGKEMMYWIHQNRAMSYRVNESHILSLKRSKNEKLKKRGEVRNVSVRELISSGVNYSNRWKGYKSGFELENREVDLDPYFLGLWLGDGTSSSSDITTADPEIVNYLQLYADSLEMPLKIVSVQPGCKTYKISSRGSSKTIFQSVQKKLSNIGVLNNKHIPDIYLYNSRNNRLKLLAGLIDSDGTNNHNGIDITMQDKELVAQIKTLADSLGLRTSVTKRIVCAQTGEPRAAWRLSINGDLSQCPILIKRKQYNSNTKHVDYTMTGFSIAKDVVDDYYGFTLDQDGLFMLEDGTVTHNTSFLISLAFHIASLTKRRVLYVTLEEILNDVCSRFAKVCDETFQDDYVTPGNLGGLLGTTQMLESMALPIDIAAVSSVTPEAIDEALEQWASENLDEHPVVMIDYLTLMAPDKMSGISHVDLNDIIRTLKIIAKKRKIIMFVAAQLKRENDKRQGYEYMLGDIQGTSGAEQHTDRVFFLRRNRPDDDVIIPVGEAYLEIIIAKNRRGEVTLSHPTQPKLRFIPKRMFIPVGDAEIKTISLDDNEYFPESEDI